MASVIVYTVTGCPFCARTKTWLKEQDVVFEERNTAENEKYVDDVLRLTGHGAVPVTLIAQQMIVGYDLPQLKAALKSYKSAT